MPERTITVRIQGANEVGPAFAAVRAELAALEAQAARTTITPGSAAAGGAAGTAAAQATAQAAATATLTSATTAQAQAATAASAATAQQAATTVTAADAQVALAAALATSSGASAAAAEASVALAAARAAVSAATRAALAADTELVAATAAATAAQEILAAGTLSEAEAATLAATAAARLSAAQAASAAAAHAAAVAQVELAAVTGATSAEMQGFETVMARRLLPTIGLVALNAGTIAAAGVLALGAGFALAARAGIELDATLEQETLRFQNFGMSAGQAAAHVQELFKLGAETPFTAEQLIQASRRLEVFGRGALDTEANLRLLGDTSAATGADLQALSFWVGRLYADLKAGKPIGEAEQNLRQLAVLTPQASKELERLAASGAPASESFAAFTRSLQGFSGAMEAQSHTLQGLTSTLVDNLGQLAGIAFAPAFDANKSALEGLDAALQGAAARNVAGAIASGLRGIGSAIDFLAEHWVGIPSDLKTFLLANALGPAAGVGAAAAGRIAPLVPSAFPLPEPAQMARFRAPLRPEDIALTPDQRRPSEIAGGLAALAESPLLAAQTRIFEVLAPRVTELSEAEQAAADALLDLNAAMSSHVTFGKQFEAQVQSEAKALDFLSSRTAAGRDFSERSRDVALEIQEMRRLDSEFGRRRPGIRPIDQETQDEEVRMAAQNARQQRERDEQAARNALALAAPGIRAQGDTLASSQALIAAQDAVRASQTRTLLERAQGQATVARADEAETARLQDQLATLQRVDTAQQQINQAVLTKAGLLIRAGQEEAAGHDAAAKGLRAEADLWDTLIGKYTAARDGIQAVTDATEANRAKEAQRRFDQEQERARGVTSNLSLQEQITQFGRTQEQVVGQREIERLTRQRDQDQARGFTEAVKRDDAMIERQQAHLRYLQEVGQNEDQLFRLNLDRQNAEIDLARAKHDGDQAEIDSANEKIRLIDEYIRKVKEAGDTIKEQPTTVPGTVFGKGVLPNSAILDPYNLSGAQPGGPRWDPDLHGMGFGGWVDQPRGTRPGDIGKAPTPGQAGVSGDFIYNQTINGDVDRPTAQQIIDAVMNIHRQATVHAIATAGSL